MTEATSSQELFASLSERVGEAMLKAWNDQVRPFTMLDEKQRAAVFAMGGVSAIVSALVAADFAPKIAAAMVSQFAVSVAQDVTEPDHG